MFEIKILITTPEEPFEFKWDCSDTQCLTEKGKRDCCRHCPIFINEKNRSTEIGILEARIENLFYQSRCFPFDVEKKILEIFDENPIKELK